MKTSKIIKFPQSTDWSEEQGTKGKKSRKKNELNYL